jgi:hypothetical protein
MEEMRFYVLVRVCLTDKCGRFEMSSSYHTAINPTVDSDFVEKRCEQIEL